MDHEIKSKIDSLEYKLIDIEIKLNKITELLEKDISPNCKKMSNHIDFIDKVYDNVKSPLGFICSKVSLLGGGSNESHSLTDK